MPQSKALIIEDDSDLAYIFAESARMASMDVEVVQDGNQAMLRLSEIIPDVVILDLHLPGVMGGDILAYIRLQERFAHTKVIITTADPYMAESLEGMADFTLIKPVGYNQLRMLVARLQFVA